MAHTLWVLSPGACQVLRVVTRAQTRASLLASASMGAMAAWLSSPSRGVAVNRAPRSAAGVSSGARSCRVSHCRVPGLRSQSFRKASAQDMLPMQASAVTWPLGVRAHVCGGIILKALDLKREMYFITSSSGAPAS